MLNLQHQEADKWSWGLVGVRSDAFATKETVISLRDWWMVKKKDLVKKYWTIIHQVDMISFQYLMYVKIW